MLIRKIIWCFIQIQVLVEAINEVVFCVNVSVIKPVQCSQRPATHGQPPEHPLFPRYYTPEVFEFSFSTEKYIIYEISF